MAVINSSYFCNKKFVAPINSLMTELPIVWNPVYWSVEQINRLVSMR